MHGGDSLPLESLATYEISVKPLNKEPGCSPFLLVIIGPCPELSIAVGDFQDTVAISFPLSAYACIVDGQ